MKGRKSLKSSVLPCLRLVQRLFLPGVAFLTEIYGSFAEILLMPEPGNVRMCTNKWRKIQSEQKRMVVKTRSRNGLERISKCPSPESVNGLWICFVLFCFEGPGNLKHFPPELAPGKGHLSPQRSGQPPRGAGFRLSPRDSRCPGAEPQGSEPQGGKGLTAPECTPSPKLLGKNIQKNNQFFFPAAGPY